MSDLKRINPSLRDQWRNDILKNQEQYDQKLKLMCETIKNSIYKEIFDKLNDSKFVASAFLLSHQSFVYNDTPESKHVYEYIQKWFLKNENLTFNLVQKKRGEDCFCHPRLECDCKTLDYYIEVSI